MGMRGTYVLNNISA
jgi:hypothetical protein